ncbi:hypothetical protein BJ508DRAFT_364080 [Ascobolus immersus RN42]|uniref:Uncharacterized protein n=1 Tax=Ascobolus immersus RN42 TaxID=1160509 RepID=A0A3N4HZU3_ASCIM|nr:hypothetical protein BJ508DRAFT_364080 [Ascobolus immersus RN42]
MHKINNRKNNIPQRSEQHKNQIHFQPTMHHPPMQNLRTHPSRAIFLANAWTEAVDVAAIQERNRPCKCTRLSNYTTLPETKGDASDGKCDRWTFMPVLKPGECDIHVGNCPFRRAVKTDLAEEIVGEEILSELFAEKDSEPAEKAEISEKKVRSKGKWNFFCRVFTCGRI